LTSDQRMEEEAKVDCLPGDTVTDDSCVTKYIEIVPLDVRRNNMSMDECGDVEIKLEDIKQEPDEVQEVDDVKEPFPDAAAEVRPLDRLC